MENKTKTPDYIRRAIKKYKESKEVINIMVDAGTKDRIKEKYGAGVSINGYIKRLIDSDLKNTPKADSLPWEN